MKEIEERVILLGKQLKSGPQSMGGKYSRLNRDLWTLYGKNLSRYVYTDYDYSKNISIFRV